MRRFKLIIEYDGGPFVGWQKQDNGPSVQAAIEDAALAFCGETTTAHAAGRTDAGVHALAMTAHFDLPTDHAADTVRDAMNAYLRPRPISVLAAEETDSDFHARFSAKARHYLYRIVNRRSPAALEAGRVWQVPGALDERAMQAAAAALVGKHDFSTFRSIKCQSASPVKTLSALTVQRDGESVVVAASAPSFLHHQVRSMVGSLVQVGLGRWREGDLRAALEARDRSACGPVAPAHGLYFARADYESAL